MSRPGIHCVETQSLVNSGTVVLITNSCLSENNTCFRPISLIICQELREAGASSEQEQVNVVSELLSRTSVLSATPGETSLLHFAQEQARRDVEIQAVRRQKHTAEAALRDLQHASSMKEEQLTEQVRLL